MLPGLSDDAAALGVQPDAASGLHPGQRGLSTRVLCPRGAAHSGQAANNPVGLCLAALRSVMLTHIDSHAASHSQIKGSFQDRPGP